MIEVEAKVGIPNPKRFRTIIQKIATYKGTKRKIDDYYTTDSLKEFPKRSLRIRKLDGHYEVNIKNKISYVKGVHAKREIELRSAEQGSLPAFIEIIRDLGFKRWLRKEKTSETYNIKKNFNIELNHVNHLGWFIEIEYLSDLKGMNKARREVLDVVKKLGINEKDIIKDGYTKMMWNRKIRGF